MSKNLGDYWQPEEKQRFDALFELVSCIDGMQGRLAGGAHLLSSASTDIAVSHLARLVSAERRDWLNLARERAAGDNTPIGDGGGDAV